MPSLSFLFWSPCYVHDGRLYRGVSDSPDKTVNFLVGTHRELTEEESLDLALDVIDNLRRLPKKGTTTRIPARRRNGVAPAMLISTWAKNSIFCALSRLTNFSASIARISHSRSS